MKVLLTWLVVVLIACTSADGEVIKGDKLGETDYVGRVSSSDGYARFDWTDIQITATYSGITAINATFDDSTGNTYNAFLNGALVEVLNTSSSIKSYPIASSLNPNTEYTVLLTKRTEALFGIATFTGFTVSTSSKLNLPSSPSHSKRQSSRRIEFIGDSITCGYGDEGHPPCGFSAATENEFAAYGPLTAAALQAEIFVECWSGKGMVRNYGSPNTTSPDPFPVYYPRLFATDAQSKWTFSNYVPDAVVINLGTNDYSTQPIPPQQIFQSGYNAFMAFITAQYSSQPNLKFFLVCGPLIGNPCCQYVQEVASQHSNAVYVNMQGILNGNDYGCDGHPNTSGHAKMSAVITPIIRSTMGWN